MQDALLVCKNCRNQFQGNYCNECGEKVYTEINSFYLYFTFFVIPLVFIGGVLIIRIFVHGWTFSIDDRILNPIVYSVVGVYTAVAIRRFYKEKKAWAIIKSALFLVAHSVIVYTIYRFILFCTVQLFI